MRRLSIPTEQELIVVGAILNGSGDSRAAQFLEQFRTTKALRRKVVGSSMEIEMESTTENLLAVLDHDVTSDPVELHDLATGKPLSFSVTLRRGGFFGSLRGRTTGKWPRRWTVDPSVSKLRARGALVLDPTRHAPGELVHWLGLGLGEVVPILDVGAPASASDIANLVRREGMNVPREMREFLILANGLHLEHLSVFGAADAYVVEFGDGMKRWVVGQGRGGERAYLCGPNGDVVVDLVQSTDPRSLVQVADSFREWVKMELAI